MICWTDVETTGLSEREGHLLEVALILTDDDLNEIAATSVVVQPVGISIDAAMANADPVVQEMHKINGLVAELQRGEETGRGVRRHEAEAYLVDWAKDVAMTYPNETPLDAKEYLKHIPLAGSTVGFDKKWLHEHMLTLESLFSYRSIDVSSITELAERWASAIYEGRPKAGAAHRALADARESIAHLRYYRESGFVARGEHSR